eukprot:scaffold226570_cov24-Tisochrysis_lutea.AAC.3
MAMAARSVRCPVEAAEESAAADYVGGAETFLYPLREEAAEERFALGRDRYEQPRLLVQDLGVDVGAGLAAEGGHTGEHLEKEHAKGPPVDAVAVRVAAHHLGGKVLRRAADGARGLGINLAATPVRPKGGPQPLGEPKVDKLEVAVFVQQKILGLQVAVDHAAHLVEIGKHLNHRCHVKTSGRLIQPADDVQDGEEFTA